MDGKIGFERLGVDLDRLRGMICIYTALHHGKRDAMELPMIPTLDVIFSPLLILTNRCVQNLEIIAKCSHL